MTNEKTAVAKPNLELPTLELFSMNELQEMALQVTLAKMGVKNPTAFLKANDVTYRSTFKVGVGMGITVLSVTPRPEPSDSKPVQS